MERTQSKGGRPPPEEEGPLRWLAFGRYGKILAAKSSAMKVTFASAADLRYAAYSSDLGEAFRPVAGQRFVQAMYGVSWAYIVGQVGKETYLEHAKESPPEVVRETFVRTATFQVVASLLLPALLIHSGVHGAQKIVKRLGQRYATSFWASPRMQLWGPTAVGLAMIPPLPVLVDEPAEHLIESGFDIIYGKDEHEDHKNDTK